MLRGLKTGVTLVENHRHAPFEREATDLVRTTLRRIAACSPFWVHVDRFRRNEFEVGASIFFADLFGESLMESDASPARLLPGL